VTNQTNTSARRCNPPGWLNIVVAGATTDSPVYTWTVLPAQITAPMVPLEDCLATRKADINIKLTHIGN